MRTTRNNTDNTEQKKTQNVVENDQVSSQQRSRLPPVKLAKEKPSSFAAKTFCSLGTIIKLLKIENEIHDNDSKTQ